MRPVQAGFSLPRQGEGREGGPPFGGVGGAKGPLN
jgi:hypothetical protein